MKTLGREELDKYLEDDYILRLLNSEKSGAFKGQQCHNWLVESPPKRMMCHYVYGSIFKSKSKNLRVLDVGGGLSGLIPHLAESAEYALIEIANIEKMGEALNGVEVISGDWGAHVRNKKWDIVIANDLFPNVDQRLRTFLDRYIDCCKEIILTLTTFENGRFYKAKRLDGDEILTMAAWRKVDVSYILKEFKYTNEIGSCGDNQDSLFANGRHVSLVKVRGRGGG